MVVIDSIKGLIDSLGKAIDDNTTSDEERLILRNELAKLQAGLEEKLTAFQEKMNEGQVEINKTEAESPSFFKSGWRPAVGWIGVFGLGYHFILFPFMEWITEIYYPDVIPPMLDSEGLMGLVTAMLGIGGYRTYEKFKGLTR